MQKFLAVDTAAAHLTVLACGKKTALRFVENCALRQSVMLMGEVESAMEEAELAPAECDFFCAVTGPGSFTGIRIGAATAAAICRGTGAKKIAVTEFELIAYDRGTVNAAVEAGRGNLYCAHCRNGAAEETYFLSAEERADAEREGGFVCDTVRDRAQVFAEIALKKAESGEYAAAFEPFYMRKSQAERAQDEV